jgi:hypothetical protein
MFRMSINRRPVVVALVSFVCGAIAFAGVDFVRSRASDARADDVARHRKLVNDYRAHIFNPANDQPDPQTCLRVSLPPSDPLPSLAALVSAGELQYVDLVFPKVPNSGAANRLWMPWGQRNPDVLYVTGNPDVGDLMPSGTPPLHLQVWYRNPAEAALKQLVRDLEQLPTDAK